MDLHPLLDVLGVPNPHLLEHRFFRALRLTRGYLLSNAVFLGLTQNRHVVFIVPEGF